MAGPGEIAEGRETAFEDEYLWENFIIRLWRYRPTVGTPIHLRVESVAAKGIRATFDRCFQANGKTGPEAIWNMIEHFDDDDAAGEARGPVSRERELDPWRTVMRDSFERGWFVIERPTA